MPPIEPENDVSVKICVECRPGGAKSVDLLTNVCDL